MGNASIKTCLDAAEARAEQISVISLSVSLGVSAFALVRAANACPFVNLLDAVCS